MNIRNTPIFAIASVLEWLWAAPASAHTFGAEGAGMVEGLAHPFLGLDHLLAMVAVGFWATQLGGRALWQVPLAFVFMMAGGAWLGHLNLGIAHVELMIAISVLALGMMIAASVRLSTAASVMAVSVFALFHGYAHGQEMPQAGAPLVYAGGFVLATVCLHLIGIGLGQALSRRPRVARLAGGLVATAGACLLVGQGLA
jgi:urease accessory protein